ncbi:MAG: glycosyltransferase family 4 protein [Phycisphaeraceae bacterium]
MRPLILTNNPNLASTSRVLQQWLTGSGDTLDACVATQREGEFSGWLEANNIPHQITPMPQPSKRWPLPGMWYAWRLASWARAQNVDAIHCNEHDVYPFALLVKRLLQVPIVCHVRFRISTEFCRWAFGRPQRQPDALLWTSQQQQLDCAEAIEGIVPEEKQHIIPLGVDLNRIGDLTSLRTTVRQAWGIDEDAIVLAQACALRPIKQLEHFVDLVADLTKQDSRIVGIVAGDAPPGGSSYRDELNRYADRAQLGNRLRWLGHVDAIEPLLAGADIFVSTSQYETFGNSVCEAMACGTPVVGYEGGSVKEVVGDTGRIVKTGDRAGLGAAVRELVADGAERKDLGRLARERVAACFNPAGSLRKLKEIYASILEQRSTQRWAA